MKKSILFLFGAFFSASLFAQTTPPAPFAPQTVKAFADSLFTDGFFAEAESEYKRYLFSTDALDFSAVLPLATIYNTQNNKAGIFWLWDAVYADATPAVQEKINIVKGRMLFLERDEPAFSDFAAQIQPTFSAFSLDFQNIVACSRQLLLRNIPEATAITNGAAQENEVFAELSALCAQYKTKSPGLALFLSALVPGLGKWYGGTFGGFTTDFLSVGSFVAGTVYTGIKSDWRDWRPYVFGTAGLVLYIVDLYGSYQNAKRYNEAQFRHLCEAADDVYEKLY